MDYQGNADKDKKPKPPDKKIEKVITGEVVRKPKPVAKRMRDTFFGGDFKVAATYVAGDVLLPALRNLVVDMVSKGVERVIFGESRFRRPTEMRPRVQYNNPALPRAPIYVDPRERGPVHLPGQPPRYRNNRRDITDIILVNRADAEAVVVLLYDILEKYEVVSLADLYDALEQPTSHIDNKWGWTVLQNVEIRQVREGYLIELPPLEEI